MFGKKGIVKKYSNGEVTIVWKPDLCVHAAHCFLELPEVFDPSERPWINAKGANTDKIIKQVKKCPTAALSFFMNDGLEVAQEKPSKDQNSFDDVRIELLPNGPMIVKGGCLLIHEDGREEKREGNFTLCRCGLSKRQPFCDASHLKRDK